MKSNSLVLFDGKSFPISFLSHLQAMQLLCCLRGHSFPVTAMCAMENELLSGDLGGSVVIWNMKLRRPRLIFKASTMGIIQINTWKQQIIVQSRDNIISIWCCAEQDGQSQAELIKFVRCDSLTFCSFDVNLDGCLVYTFEDRVVVNDFERDVLVQSFEIPQGHGAAMCLDAKQGNVIIGMEDGSVITISGDGGFQIASQLHSEPVLTICSTGNKLLSAGASNQLISSGIPGLLLLESITLPDAGVAKVTAFQNDADTIIICGCWNGSILYLNNSKIEQVIQEHRKGIQSLCIDEQSKSVFAGGDDCKISVYKY